MVTRSCCLIAALALGAGAINSTAFAQVVLDHDIDLFQEEGMFNESVRGRDSNLAVGPNRDVRMDECGQLLAALSTLSQYYLGSAGGDRRGVPLFPAPHAYGGPTLEFSPSYEHYFLESPDTDHPFLGWGYKGIPKKSCSVVPRHGALQLEGVRVMVFGGLTGLDVIDQGLTGLRWKVYAHGLDAAARDVINTNLFHKRPTLVTHQEILTLTIGGITSTQSFFSIDVIVGWDATSKMYRVVSPDDNPYLVSSYIPHVPGSTSTPVGALLSPEIRAAYAKWESDIVQVIDVQPVARYSRYLRLGDDPSPIKFLVINPDGRRTGFDPATQNILNEDPDANYSELGPWADPLLELPPANPVVELSVRDPVEGTYRFEILATADGPATFSFSTIDAGGVPDDAGETLLQTVSGTMSAGQTRKYEVQYSATGTSAVTEVAKFTPQAVPGRDIATTLQASAALDGSRSFGVDGNIVSYQWDFGDGTTADSAQATHLYANAGVFVAQLTVIDDQGTIGRSTIHVAVSDPAGIAGRTARVDLSSAGALAQVPFFTSTLPVANAISADGHIAAFLSRAANLVARDTNGSGDIFARDLVAGTTDRVNVSSDGVEDDSSRDTDPVFSVSADGRFVAFASLGTLAPLPPGTPFGFNPAVQVYVRDRLTQTTEFVSLSTAGALGNGASMRPSISGDGRFVAFTSRASNLVADDTNGVADIFVRDRMAGTTTRVSVSSAGAQSITGTDGPLPFQTQTCNPCGTDFPAISADGRFVAFGSVANDLVSGDSNAAFDIFVNDRSTRTTERVNLGSGGAEDNGAAFKPSLSISGDGRYVAFTSVGSNLVPGDSNGMADVFVRDRLTLNTERVSVSSAGGEADGPADTISLSADGRFVVFQAFARNLTADSDPDRTRVFGDVFVRDRVKGTTELLIPPPAPAFQAYGALPHVSGDGRFVTLTSQEAIAPPLIDSGVAHLFVRDRGALARPIADPSGPYIGWSSTNSTQSFIQFDGSRSFDPNGAAIVGATWDFGDGSSPVDATSLAPVRHTYAAAGKYKATLVVSNGSTDSAPATTGVEVLGPAAPDVVSVTPQCGDPGSAVHISGIATSINQHTFGGVNLASGTLSLPHIVLQDFSQTRSVSVLPNDLSFDVISSAPAQLARGVFSLGIVGGASAQFIMPCPASPHVPVADAGGPYIGTIGIPVQFDGAASGDGDGDPLTYAWTFGDGSTEIGVRPLHTYDASGKFVASLVVSDSAFSSSLTPGTRSFASVIVSEPSAGDTQPPATVASVTPAPNAAGWNNTNVTMSLAAADSASGSGIKQITFSAVGAQPIATTTVNGRSTSVFISSEGETTVTFFATDVAGNVEPAKTVTVTLDKTPPVIRASRFPEANPNGWNNTNVTVSFSCSDTLSGVPPGGPPVDTVLSNQGAAQSVTHICHDLAGNSASATVGDIHIDKMAPTMTCAANPGTLWPPDHRMVPIVMALNVSDALSGAAGFHLQSVTSNEPDHGLGDGDTAQDIQGWDIGSPDITGMVRAERSGRGTGRLYTLIYTATDKAGNSARCTTGVSVPHDK